MQTKEQFDKSKNSWKIRLAREKTDVYAEFLEIYGEQASWEDWQDFLLERPELEGFEWARCLMSR